MSAVIGRYCLVVLTLVLAPCALAEVRLAPSDLAILYPLKPTPEPNGIFAEQGDGFCNAPSLEATKILPALIGRKDFNYLVDRAFGVQAKIEPPHYLEIADDDLPTELIARKRYYEQWSDLPAAQANRVQQLAAIDEAYSTTAYDEPLYCYQPSLAGGIADLGEDYQLELGHHLVQSEGVLAKACTYDAWRVVAIRFNPCLEQAEIKEFWQGDSLPVACKTRELRLVAQPVYREDGQVKIADAAMHFIYNLSLKQMAGVVRALRQIKSLTPLSANEAISPLTLAPHLGLRKEMDRCDGEVAGALRQLLVDFAQPEALSSVAWMSSSASQSRWSFGSVAKSELAPAPDDQTSESAITSSISIKELSQKVDRFPFVPATMDAHELTIAPIFQKPFRNPKQPVTSPRQLERARRLFDGLDTLANPHRISQVAQNPRRFSSDCVSCHMLAQSKEALAAAVDHGADGSGMAIYRNRAGQTAVPWPLLPRRRPTNFRNFGYGPGSSDEFLPAISERVSHEALNLADVVAKFFVAPAED